MLRHVNGAGGVPIACETAGRGVPLVLVHGAGSARVAFDALRPQLERSFAVTTVDRRGRGDSGDGGGDYLLADEFEDVAAVVRDAGEDALLFAHSYGALVAAGAATLLEGLAKLVLYEPPMGGVLADQAWTERFEARLEAGERASAVREFLRHVGGYTDSEIDAMRDTPSWRARLAAAPTVPRELRAEAALALEGLALERVGAACLLLVGSDSPDWARRSTEAYAGALADVCVHVLEGQAHGAVAGAPELVAAELTRFLLA